MELPREGDSNAGASYAGAFASDAATTQLLPRRVDTSPVAEHDALFKRAFSSPELARFVPGFELLIDALASVDDAALLRRPLAPLPLVALWLLRDGRDPHALLAHLTAFALALEALADGPQDDVVTVLRYLVLVTGELPFEQVRREFARASTKLEEEMVSHFDRAYENGKREGLEQGLEQGRVEALRATLVRQLSARFGPLPEDAARSVASASLDELDRWVDRVIPAASLEGVFHGG